MLAAGQSRGAIILEAATYLAALDTSNASFGSSAALFNNRVSVATYHTITSEAADPWAIPASVTSSPLSVAVGTAAVDTALNPPAPPPAAAEPKTLSLTSGVNNLAGGAAADTFDGSLNNSSLQTLTTVDTVDGGAGADLLTATLNNGLTIRPTISGVETINLGAVTNNSTINLASTTGATKYQLAGSSANLTLTNVDSASAAIEAVGNSGALSIGYTDAALAGTDDVSVAVDGQTGGVTFTDAGGSNKLETLSISAENTASSFALTTTNVGTSALNISGDADLTLTGLSTAVASIDASAATGDVNVTAGITTAGLTFTGGTGADTVKNASTATAYYDNLSGGAGNDTFTLDADGFTSKDSIAGGDGTDKITFFDGDADTTTDADFTAVTGVEKLQAQTGQALTATLGDKAAAAGIASVVTSTGNDVITAEADYGALNVTLSTGDDKVDNALSSSALTATAAAASIDANDTITGGSGSSDKLVITADSNATGAVLSANVTLIESCEF
jgi:hypothetical protein